MIKWTWFNVYVFLDDCYPLHCSSFCCSDLKLAKKSSWAMLSKWVSHKPRGFTDQFANFKSDVAWVIGSSEGTPAVSEESGRSPRKQFFCNIPKDLGPSRGSGEPSRSVCGPRGWLMAWEPKIAQASMLAQTFPLKYGIPKMAASTVGGIAPLTIKRH